MSSDKPAMPDVEIVEIDIPERRFSQLLAITSTFIYALDDDSILKSPPTTAEPTEWQMYDIEIRAYKRLGEHPRIATLREVTEEGLILERGECVHRKTLNAEWGPVALDTRLRWAQEAAEGLCYIHEKGIVHADVGCSNLIIDRSGHIKFIDFGGSSIDGEPALVCYQWYAYKPTSAPCVQTDIFAFGSTLFELETGNIPFHELQGTVDEYQIMKVAQNRFLQKEYPNLDNLIFASIIRYCWDGDYTSMQEVIRDLDGCVDAIRSDARGDSESDTAI